MELLGIETMRNCGEVQEVTDSARNAGFGVPVFISNILHAELQPGSDLSSRGIDANRNIKGLLDILFYLGQGVQSQDIQFEYTIPVWDDTCGKITARTLLLNGTIFFLDENEPFILLTTYTEVADILEGRPQSD